MTSGTLSGATCTLLELEQTAQALGFDAEGRWENSKQLRDDSSPRILELSFGHFVAFLGKKGDWPLIYDPIKGLNASPEEWSWARLESEWTEKTLTVRTRRTQHRTQDVR